MRTLTAASGSCLVIMATEEEYDHIYAFISNHEYRTGFGKNEKAPSSHNNRHNHCNTGIYTALKSGIFEQLSGSPG